MVNLLASVVEVTGPDGEHVVIDPTGIIWGVTAQIILFLVPVVIVLLFFFYKKKLQNQQILAAMEKGLPVKDLLEPPKKKGTAWVANISAGVGMLFIAIALGGIFYTTGLFRDAIPEKSATLLAIPTIIGGIGLIRLVRGLFQKAEMKDNPVEDNDEEEQIETSPPAIRAE